MIDPVACNAIETVLGRVNAGEARGHVRGAVIRAKPRDDPLLARLAPQVVVVVPEANGGIVGGRAAGGIENVIEPARCQLGQFGMSRITPKKSTQKTILVVPTQRRCVGLLREIFRYVYRITLKAVVIPTILELGPDAATDLEMVVGRHCHVAGVEQAVDVAPQQ